MSSSLIFSYLASLFVKKNMIRTFIPDALFYLLVEYFFEPIDSSTVVNREAQNIVFLLYKFLFLGLVDQFIERSDNDNVLSSIIFVQCFLLNFVRIVTNFFSQN